MLSIFQPYFMAKINGEKSFRPLLSLYQLLYKFQMTPTLKAKEEVIVITDFVDCLYGPLFSQNIVAIH